MPITTKEKPKAETPESTTISIYVPGWVAQRLSERAEKERRSVSRMATILLEEALKT